MPSPENTHEPPLRGDASGWSRDVSRRNTDFLLSVQADLLTGYGFALSLTVKDCPPTPQVWAGLRRAFLKRLERMGLTRSHWLTEWQRRGVPHAHSAVWFDAPVSPDLIREHWLQVSAAYRSGRHSQNVKPIRGPVGWFEYLAKHATRSVTNYQRSPENIPQQWEKKTGRMWGHTGDWPTVPKKNIDVPERVWHHYRRLMILYQIGKARRLSDCSRVRYLKAYRSKAPRETSYAQPPPRFWIPEADQWRLLALALSTHSDEINA